MLCSFNHLDRRLITDIDGDIWRQGDLRQAERARVGAVCRPVDTERWKHRMAHVRWLLTETQVEVEERRFVSRKPAGLNGDGAPLDGPFGSVS